MCFLVLPRIVHRSLWIAASTTVVVFMKNDELIIHDSFVLGYKFLEIFIIKNLCCECFYVARQTVFSGNVGK